ncbi:hypothetical protein KCU73_g9225, partial [Aureobasidium melanogenum]
MAPSSPPASDQGLHRSPSHSPPPDLHDTPASPEPHKSNTSSFKEETAPIADASTLEVTKPAQAAFPFLLLPPEIRNMIYNYIFAPVRDGKCWIICTDYKNTRLRGFRRNCRCCSSGIAHPTCHPKLETNFDGFRSILEITDNYTHSGILQTCHAIHKEAMPVSLAHVHISFDSISISSTDIHEPFRMFLANMRQPQGAYLSKLTFSCYEYQDRPADPKLLALLINQANLKLGSLDLFELPCFSRAPQYRFLKHFVDLLESLDNLPTSVRWLNFFNELWSKDLDEQKLDFNNAVVMWREKLATVRAGEQDTPAPLLRDFLPRYFSQPSD